MSNTAKVSQPLRIALLSYRSNPFVGGQGVYIKYLSQSLAALGHKVDVLSGPPYPHLSDAVNLIKIPSLDLFESPNHLRALRWRHLISFADTFEWWSMATGGFAEPYTFGRRVAKYLETHSDDYDIIHDNQSLCYALTQLEDKGLPILSTVHHPITRDLQLALEGTKDWGHRLLIKRWHSFIGMQTKVVRKLKHVITVSECSRRDIATEFGRPETDTDIIYNGIDTKLFCPQKNIEKIPFRLITTSSSDQPLKGFTVLLKSLKRLRPLFPELHLQVIGKLKENGQNEKLMHELGLSDIISFKSGIDHEEIANEYSKASIAVCPSLYEGFGLPAGEAMSCGVPLVCSDGGALPEVVGDAGLLVPAGDDQAMADAISRILNDPALAQELSTKGRERILNNFCWDKVARQLSKYYRQHVIPNTAK